MQLLQDGQHTHHHGPLAGVSAGAMAVLVGGGVILLACRHQLAEVANWAAVLLIVRSSPRLWPTCWSWTGSCGSGIMSGPRKHSPADPRSALKSWTRRRSRPGAAADRRTPRSPRTPTTTSTAPRRSRPHCRRCTNGRSRRPVMTQPDPVAILAVLGAVWSPDFDAYASGQLSISASGACSVPGRPVSTLLPGHRP